MARVFYLPSKRVLDIIRALLLCRPRVFDELADIIKNSKEKEASTILTREFRRLVPPHTLHLPEGAIVASLEPQCTKFHLVSG